MRFITIFAAAFVAATSFGPTAFGAVTVLDERADRVTVRVGFGSAAVPDARLSTLEVPGKPALRFERFLVAIPPGASVRARQVGGSFVSRSDLPPLREPWGPGIEASPPPSGLFPANPIVVSKPFIFRRTRVVAVSCYASQVDYQSGVHRVWSDYDVVVDYPASTAASPDRSGAGDPLLASVVVNTPVVSAEPRSRLQAQPVPDPHFSLSANWIKIRIASPGVYAITGSDLVGMGVSLSSIMDPASFRVFTAGGREQLRSLLSGAGTYAPGTWADECDIVVEYGGDGSFDPGDRVIFYALGSRGFGDLYEPGVAREVFYDHLYAKENVYYLTWDSSFPGQPARMAGAAAAPTANPDVTTYEERLYFEQNRVDDYSFGGDGWLWLDIGENTGPQTFPFPLFLVRNLDVTQPQTFRTLAVARPRASVSNLNHHARYLINGNLVTERVWNTGGGVRYEHGVPVLATGTFLQEGSNLFELNVPRDLNADDFMYFAWYSVFYHRTIAAVNDAVFFASPDTIGSVNYTVTQFATPGPRYAFDVSDAFHPVQLTGGTQTATGLRFSATVGANRAYYWVGTGGAFMRPLGMTRHFPRDLRAATTSPHMLIITDPSFTSVAQMLRQHRLQNLPLISSPRVDVVTTTEIFDNFSSGQKDPMAIRNYIKFLYDNYTEPGGGPSLTYVLLFGDANVDYKNNRNQQPDRVPSSLNLNPTALEAYATDDWYALLDTGDTPGNGIMDVAIGRLPAATFSEAEFLAQRVIAYERDTPFGDWRDRVILVADDEHSSDTDTQRQFIDLSEDLAHIFLAPYLDAQKLYLTEFPSIGGPKPTSRLRFIQDWNNGALIINYVGHGSSVQMADEQVFLAADVGKLVNGLKLPLFVAVSCTIGNFTTESKSLSERLLLRETGGVIATLTASELTYIGPNDRFDEHILGDMFPPAPGLPQPLGIATIMAKWGALSTTPGNATGEENNQKYNLLGDPALRLNSPTRTIEFTATDVDTLTAGKREIVRGRVLDGGGQPDVSFSGTVKLVVRETDDESGYVRESDGFSIDYRYPGGTVYTGTADVTAGFFEFQFKVPRYAETGDKGFVLAYASDNNGDAVGKDYSVVLRAPASGDPDALPADGPPRVDLGFRVGGRVVKPGAVLQATVNDADGINILGTTPEGRLALLFDDTALPLDATGYFQYDHGGVDTSGVLVFPLPDLAVGQHSTIVKVSDKFGQTSLDTLVFNVTDPLDYAAEIVMNYPNPFEDETHFLISLTDPAKIRLEVFTLSGKRVRTLEAMKDSGDQWITWDGRDNFGGSIANGTYLYVARVEFVGLDRPPVVLRGKIVRIH